jgi:hypothetical protein
MHKTTSKNCVQTVTDSSSLIFLCGPYLSSVGFGSRGSTACIVTRLWAERYGIPVPVQSKDVPFTMTSRLVLGSTQPSWVTRILSSDVKRPGHKADYSHKCSAQIKNEWTYTCTTAIFLHGMHRDNFTSVKV